MNPSESEEDVREEQNDIWDDSKLEHAYDKALSIASDEVAKRFAMSTNTQFKNESSTEKDHTEENKVEPSQTSGAKNPRKKVIQWKAGMACRAIYEGDEQEYEAFIESLISDTECVVRFLGYDNSEIVSISTLKPSLVSRRIIWSAATFATSAGSAERSFRKKKAQKKKKNQGMSNYLPEMGLGQMSMLNPAFLGNLGTMDMPLPPPPPIGFPSGRNNSEEQAISSMLLSWYMSGYYTGLYQGMKSENNIRSFSWC
ncbi:unnamed protein product, partial [Iphiclides podalirius]